ncbi:MAG: hypothetical protein MIL41_00575 [Hyphomicrobiales bacterium]|jgi:hypothetical protein
MSPILWLQTWAEALELFAALYGPERPAATVTDIREGHAIRARRAQRKGRRL